MSAITSLSIQQLRQAASLKEKIQTLEQELIQLLGGTSKSAATPLAAPKKKSGMSAAGRARIAAAAKARWAKVRAAKKA